jgi:hypothetical protein
LTDTHDLYIAVESNYGPNQNANTCRTDKAIAATGEDVFEIYHLDLDLDDPQIEGPIL